MSAKEELNQYKFARKRVDEALEEYRKYQDRATKMTAILSAMPRGTQNSDKVADNATRMADLSKEYEKRWYEAERYKLDVEDRINKVEEPYRTILHMRYIEGMTIEEMSFKLNSNYTYTCEQHGIALKKYEEIKDNRDQPNKSE